MYHTGPNFLLSRTWSHVRLAPLGMVQEHLLWCYWSGVGGNKLLDRGKGSWAAKKMEELQASSCIHSGDMISWKQKVQ